MIETLKTISLSGVRTVLEKVLGMVGTLDKLDCENVSPVQCRDILQYLESMGVQVLQRPPTKNERDQERRFHETTKPGPLLRCPKWIRCGVVLAPVLETVSRITP